MSDKARPPLAWERDMADGSLSLEWCRRSRGSWQWLDGVEAPLNEQRELYIVGIGDSEAPALRWEIAAPELQLDAANWAAIQAAHHDQPVWVRQIGALSASIPLLLKII